MQALLGGFERLRWRQHAALDLAALDRSEGLRQAARSDEAHLALEAQLLNCHQPSNMADGAEAGHAQGLAFEVLGLGDGWDSHDRVGKPLAKTGDHDHARALDLGVDELLSTGRRNGYIAAFEGAQDGCAGGDERERNVQSLSLERAALLG